MTTNEPLAGKVIHVQFGPGGGRRSLPPSHAATSESSPVGLAPPRPQQAPPPSASVPAPAVEPEVDERALRRRDPTGDLYARAEVSRLFGIPESRLRYWDRTGFIVPSAQVGARRLYTFQDLIGVRTAKSLLERGVPLRRVRKTVEALRTTLPDVVRPLSELRVLTDGQSVIVRDDKSSYEPRTGQVVIDFDVRELRDDVVRVLRPDALDPARRRAAYEAYLEGCRLDEDESTLDRAEIAYRRAIDLDPALANALTNLGNLRFRRGDSAEASDLYDRAIALDAEQPEAWYNLGFLAFERGEIDDAVRLFGRAVSSDPGFADAHFNLAMALEEVDRAREARVHWETYLRLDPSGPWAEIAKRHL